MKNLPLSRFTLPAMAGIVGLVAVLGLSGCGSDAYVKVQGSTTISKGQQLTDLQAALAAGALTQSEYDKLRAIILKRPG
jgi:hypothetical protein